MPGSELSCGSAALSVETLGDDHVIISSTRLFISELFQAAFRNKHAGISYRRVVLFLMFGSFKLQNK